MRPGQQNKQRMRGRGRKGPNPLSRSYESNGPDVKIRGTAQHIAEKYSTLARDSAASGDRVMAENYLQHAEHYGRIVAAAQGSFQLQQDENDGSDQMDEDGDEDGITDIGYSNAQNGNGQNGNGQNGSGQNGNGNGQPYAQDRQQERGQYDRNQGGGQPNMREGRDANRPRDNNGNRENNRDFNRDGNRENRGNRDGGQRDAAPRDAQNREPSREAGRDGGNRDFNRDGRDNRDGYQNRENRGNRERPAPNGLGPQPMLPETRPPADVVRGETQREPIQQRDPAPRDTVTGEQQRPPVSEAGRDEFRPRGDEQAGEREPRRRGRPRRAKLQDGVVDVATAGESARQAEPTENHAEAPVPTPVEREPAAPQPVLQNPLPEARTETAPEAEVKVKRKPGRPRKKKPEDDGGDDGGGGHLPAFLMASNG